MSIADWFRRRTARAPLTSSHDVAVELARARKYDEKVARHQPLRTGEIHLDPRTGGGPTP